MFGRCFPHYLEYCFHVLFYYYYYFSIKHRNNPPLQNPPLTTVTHPANPAPTSNQTCTHRKTTKNLQPTHLQKLINLHQTQYKPPKKSATNRKPPHPKTHNNPNTASHHTQKPTTTRTPQATAPNPSTQNTTNQQNNKKIHKKYNLLGQWGSRSWRGERGKVLSVEAQVGLQICFDRR